MSIFWDRKNYTSFKHTIHSKITLHQKLTYKYYPVPGCALHDHPRSGILFDHYVDRPQKSHSVYWKSHPKEYQAMLALIAAQRRAKRIVVKL